MGVFARLFGRSKAPEEAPAAEAETVAESAAAGAEDVVQAAETEEPAEDGREDGTARTEAVEPGAADAAEIPKQQSAEEAADNETGEGART